MVASFVAEQSGLVKVFDSLIDTSPTIFADLRTEVFNYWDRGLLGLTIDPQLPDPRPYVYVAVRVRRGNWWYRGALGYARADG